MYRPGAPYELIGLGSRNKLIVVHKLCYHETYRRIYVSGLESPHKKFQLLMKRAMQIWINAANTLPSMVITQLPSWRAAHTRDDLRQF